MPGLCPGLFAGDWIRENELWLGRVVYAVVDDERVVLLGARRAPGANRSRLEGGSTPRQMRRQATAGANGRGSTGAGRRLTQCAGLACTSTTARSSRS